MAANDPASLAAAAAYAAYIVSYVEQQEQLQQLEQQQLLWYCELDRFTGAIERFPWMQLRRDRTIVKAYIWLCTVRWAWLNGFDPTSCGFDPTSCVHLCHMICNIKHELRVGLALRARRNETRLRAWLGRARQRIQAKRRKAAQQQWAMALRKVLVLGRIRRLVTARQHRRARFVAFYRSLRLPVLLIGWVRRYRKARSERRLHAAKSAVQACLSIQLSRHGVAYYGALLIPWLRASLDQLLTTSAHIFNALVDPVNAAFITLGEHETVSKHPFAVAIHDLYERAVHAFTTPDGLSEDVVCWMALRLAAHGALRHMRDFVCELVPLGKRRADLQKKIEFRDGLLQRADYLDKLYLNVASLLPVLQPTHKLLVCASMRKDCLWRLLVCCPTCEIGYYDGETHCGKCLKKLQPAVTQVNLYARTLLAWAWQRWYRLFDLLHKQRPGWGLDARDGEGYKATASTYELYTVAQLRDDDPFQWRLECTKCKKSKPIVDFCRTYSTSAERDVALLAWSKTSGVADTLPRRLKAQKAKDHTYYYLYATCAHCAAPQAYLTGDAIDKLCRRRQYAVQVGSLKILGDLTCSVAERDGHVAVTIDVMKSNVHTAKHVQEEEARKQAANDWIPDNLRQQPVTAKAAKSTKPTKRQ